VNSNRESDQKLGTIFGREEEQNTLCANGRSLDVQDTHTHRHRAGSPATKQ
jgi:hypothetical protein